LKHRTKTPSTLDHPESNQPQFIDPSNRCPSGMNEVTTWLSHLDMKKVRVIVPWGEGLHWKVVFVATTGLTFLSCCGCKEKPRQVSQVLPVSVPGVSVTKTAIKDLPGSLFPIREAKHSVDAVNANAKIYYPILRVKPDPKIHYPILRVKPDPKTYYPVLRAKPDPNMY